MAPLALVKPLPEASWPIDKANPKAHESVRRILNPTPTYTMTGMISDRTPLITPYPQY
jgi:hypothetical protein